MLYGVTGPTGVLLPQGFTIDLVEDERYSVDLIATWSPDDKVSLLLTRQIHFSINLLPSKAQNPLASICCITYCTTPQQIK